MHNLDNVLDFSYERYRQILTFVRRNYTLANYQTCFDMDSFLLIRHDVDCSLNIALKIAKMEYEFGIQATYFINPHCEFYNLLEPAQTEILRKIISLGHDIGLHFDNAFHQVTHEDELELAIQKDVLLFEQYFGINIEAFSYHNPNVFLLGCDAHSYASLVNCYSRWFKDNVSYCSDSNGVWRYRNVMTALEQEQKGRLQILLHPNWWRTGTAPREKILAALYGRAMNTLSDYDAALAGAERPNLSNVDELLHSLCENERSEQLLDLLNFFAIKYNDVIVFNNDANTHNVAEHDDLTQVRELVKRLAELLSA